MISTTIGVEQIYDKHMHDSDSISLQVVKCD